MPQVQRLLHEVGLGLVILLLVLQAAVVLGRVDALSIVAFLGVVDLHVRFHLSDRLFQFFVVFKWIIFARSCLLVLGNQWIIRLLNQQLCFVEVAVTWLAIEGFGSKGVSVLLKLRLRKDAYLLLAASFLIFILGLLEQALHRGLPQYGRRRILHYAVSERRDALQPGLVLSQSTCKMEWRVEF